MNNCFYYFYQTKKIFPIMIVGKKIHLYSLHKLDNTQTLFRIEIIQNITNTIYIK